MAKDYTGVGTGALSGASTGATIGSVVPGVGTAIGAAAGGLAGGIAGLFGSKKRKSKFSTLDKRQKKLNKQQHAAIEGKGPLADLYNYNPEAANDVFEKTIANPTYKNLNQKDIPALTGQFRSNGIMNSSYAGNAIGDLIQNVQNKLEGERSKYLYDEQNNARSAKRNAIESLQDRQTFATDPNASRSSFDINKVLSSITPGMVDQTRNYFKPKPNPATIE